MATKVVSRLVASLELDTTKLQEGVAKAKAAAKEIGDSFKQAGGRTRRSLEDAGNASTPAANKIKGTMMGARFALIMVAVAAKRLNDAFGFPALRKMTEDVVTSETKTLRLAESLHLNTTELQAWQKVVQQHGGTADDFNSSLMKMSANLGKIGTQVRGAKLLQQYLDLAGVTDALVQGRDALGVLKLFAQQMGGMTPQRQILVGKRLGLDDTTIRSLQEGGAALAEDVAQARNLAAANEELQNARQVAEAQAAANLQWERAKQVIAQSFLPILRKLAADLQIASKWIEQHQKVVKEAAFAIGFALAGLAAATAAAAAIIVIKGALIAVGMTAATGGAWAAGVAAGIAALGALGLAVGDLSGAFDSVTDAHAGMVDEIINGDKRIQAAFAAQQQLKRWADSDAKSIANVTAKIKELRAEAFKLTEEAARTGGNGGFLARILQMGNLGDRQAVSTQSDARLAAERDRVLKQAKLLQDALNYAQGNARAVFDFSQGRGVELGRHFDPAEFAKIADAIRQHGGTTHVGEVNIYTEKSAAQGLHVEVRGGVIDVNGRSTALQPAGGMR